MIAAALLEIRGFSNALVVCDTILKTVSVNLQQLEITNGFGEVTLKLRGDAEEVRTAMQVGKKHAEQLHAFHACNLLLNPDAMIEVLLNNESLYNLLLEAPEIYIPQSETGAEFKNQTWNLGLVETNSLVSAIRAADIMVKSAKVKLIGKYKMGGSFVCVIVNGSVAEATAAVEAAGNSLREQNRLFSSRVISNLHPVLIGLFNPP